MPRRRLALLVLSCLACSPPRSPAPSGGALGEPAVAATPAAVTLPPPDPREATLAAAVATLLETHHLRKRPFDDALSREAWKTYLDRLDPTKMFLLLADAAALDRFTDQIDDEMRSGDLELAHEGARIFAARVTVVEKLVAELLAAPLDLGDDEWYETDPEKVERCASDGELRERWRQRLEMEVLERVSAMDDRLAAGPTATPPDGGAATPPTGSAGTGVPGVPHDLGEEPEPASTIAVADIPATPEARQAKVRAELAVAYSGRFARLRAPRPLDASATLMNAVAATFDPHTNYLPPSDKANFDIQMSGSLEGIGAVLRERDHLIEVAEIVPGGASWRQGRLAVGDLILSVASAGQPPVDVTDMPVSDVVKMVRGPKGTVVTLRIRKASGEEETLAITRDIVVIEEAYARAALLTPTRGGATYGYIYLPSFYGGGEAGQRTSAGDVRRLLDTLRARKVAGVVIDVRSNGGGLLGAAVEITGQLVDRGPVVQVQDSAGRREVLEDERAGTSFDGPVVVMVDRFSASAAEILAGALQDYRRAVVVGTGNTHGKGTVQSLASLDRMTGGKMELGVLKITIQQFFRVSGSSTQREGVAPDVVLPDPVGFLETGERELEHAIPWSQIQPVAHAEVPHAWKRETLVARSAARVSRDPVFAKIVARSQLLRSWRDDTRVPLARAAFDARRKAHRAALEGTSASLDRATPRFAVKLVDAAAVAPPASNPGGRTDDRPERWRDALARDPWVGESLRVLADMSRR